MTNILGISAFYHDSAAALIVDGTIVAAAQEERFTRKKHDASFPREAVAYCLKEAGISANQLDYVAFYEKPLLKFDRLLETYLAFAPRGFASFCKAMPQWLKQKIRLPRELRRGLDHEYKKRFLFPEHHESHAASAFFPSPFEEAAILTVDGVGEWATASLGVGRGSRVELLKELRFPHSLGMLYSAFTYFCGFRVNSGEYKLMGLAPYGEPKYADLIREKLLDLKPDGSFRMKMRYFNYCQGLTMTSRKFNKLFGGPPRKPESDYTQRELDLAASVQLVTEEIMLRMGRHAHEQTGLNNLCLAGGVALNCVANGRLLREGPFHKIWIQPAAGDAGGALGAALLVWYQLLKKTRMPHGPDLQQGSLLGPKFGREEIKTQLDASGARYRELNSDEAVDQLVARAIAEEKVVGWFQGRMEFGPRALGSRSILGDARSAKMQTMLNVKIKFRESFRPFAPAVLEERAGDFFEVAKDVSSPYMLLVAQVHPNQLISSDGQPEPAGLERRSRIRSSIPAVTHVDNSARLQTVNAEQHGRFHQLIQAFERETGTPVVINTSFNVRAEPIVCTPADAYRCFLATHMDVLVIENFVLLKEEQPDLDKQEVEQYLAGFPLD
jgi:carbamoyltransferase